jgi:Flp pilus assembly protein TadB
LYTEKPAHNIMLACFWFLLATLVAAAAIAVLFSSSPFLMPGLLLMSMVLLMTARQRVRRFAIEQQKFVKQVRFVALLSAVFCGVSAMLNVINAALV